MATRVITISDYDIELLTFLYEKCLHEDQAGVPYRSTAALGRIIAAANDPLLSFGLDDAGVAELRTAYDSASQVRGRFPDLDRATQAVLGIVPPRMVDGPGVLELRIAVAKLPQGAEYESSFELRRWIRAAQLIVGERNP